MYLKKEIIKTALQDYTNTLLKYSYINKTLKFKKIRNNNFPEFISEHLVLYHLRNKFNLDVDWDIKKGDLVLNKTDKLEVKCVASKGPMSFGPSQDWVNLYILDITNQLNCIIYKIDSKESFFNVKVNKNETIRQQSEQKRRPRITLKTFLEHCKHEIIFKGNIQDILV